MIFGPKNGTQIESKSNDRRLGPISGPENIGANDVKFGPFFGQKVARKLKANQMIQNPGPSRAQKTLVPTMQSLVHLWAKKWDAN